MGTIIIYCLTITHLLLCGIRVGELEITQLLFVSFLFFYFIRNDECHAVVVFFIVAAPGSFVVRFKCWCVRHFWVNEARIRRREAAASSDDSK